MGTLHTGHISRPWGRLSQKDGAGLGLTVSLPGGSLLVDPNPTPWSRMHLTAPGQLEEVPPDALGIHLLDRWVPTRRSLGFQGQILNGRGIGLVPYSLAGRFPAHEQRRRGEKAGACCQGMRPHPIHSSGFLDR